MFKPFCLLLTCMAVCTAPHADVYRSINDKGIAEFSDRATSATAKKFTISKPVIIDALPKNPSRNTLSANQSRQEAEPSATGSPYQGIRILEPQANSARWVQEGLTVSIDLDPGLAAGHEIAVMLDGVEVAAGDDFTYLIAEILRGQHTLQAQVRDKDSGETLTSETISFQVHRHSARTNTEMLHPSLQTESPENPSDINVILSE